LNRSGNEESERPPGSGAPGELSQYRIVGRISRAAVYKAIDQGRIDTLKVGNVTLVDRRSAEKYQTAREQKQPSTAKPRTKEPAPRPKAPRAARAKPRTAVAEA
jgi:hypothetical protein